MNFKIFFWGGGGGSESLIIFFLGGGGEWRGGVGWGMMGYDETVDILGGHHKTGLLWGVISKYSRAFLRSRYRIGIFLGVANLQ